MLRGITEGSIVGVGEAVHGRLERYRTVNDFVVRERLEIGSEGDVLDSLEAALWVFYTSWSFQEGARKVVDLGGRNTMGAIFGGLAGAFYGVEGVPRQWVQGTASLELVDEAVVGIIRIRNEGPPSHWMVVPEPTSEQIEWMQDMIRVGNFNIE